MNERRKKGNIAERNMEAGKWGLFGGQHERLKVSKKEKRLKKK